MTDWNLKDTFFHKFLPTTISSFKNIIMEADVDMNGNKILNCSTLDKFLFFNKNIQYPLIRGSLLSYNLNNEMSFTNIVIDENTLNLGEKQIVNCKSINFIKFTDKTTDFCNKRICGLGNPRFLTDAVNKITMINEVDILQKQIDELKKEIELLKKL